MNGHLAAYVTSHGFGHLNRAASVLEALPASLPLTIVCSPDLFPHWRERLKRPFQVRAGVFDAGAVNPAGDSQSTDVVATIRRAREVHAHASAALDDEARWLREAGATAVFCDVPALPVVAGRRAGVPAYLLANFTWYDIYAPMVRAIGTDDDREWLRGLRADYLGAALLFRSEPALAMSWMPRRMDVGLVTSPGRDRRAELRRLLGLSGRERLAFFYVGRYGQDDLDWDRMAALEKRGVHFVGYHPAPVGPIANLHLIPAEEWNGADLTASSDFVMAKAGYGSASSAMEAGVPLLYPPRRGFAEHRALDRALRSWGGGRPTSSRDFREFRLERFLEALKPGERFPAPYPADGAARVAARLSEACRKREAV